MPGKIVHSFGIGEVHECFVHRLKLAIRPPWQLSVTDSDELAFSYQQLLHHLFHHEKRADECSG